MQTIAQSQPDPNDLTLSEEDRRELIGWAAGCIYRLLPIFTRHRPADDRLEIALNSTSQFRAGMLSIGPMRKQAFACHAAARECDDPAAEAVARACGQAVAIAHMGGHARNVERYTRKALSGPALTEELAWQRAHVTARMREYIFTA
ncbi:hypothetical protein B2J88_39560 [Rhodococcus sp. SRB_17]|nr:hypothetical protein [Rhodococcus sp. SRB_17]